MWMTASDHGRATEVYDDFRQFADAVAMVT
jgi:hypothetical protein